MTDGAAIERPPLTPTAGLAAIRIDERDNVAVALRLIPAGDRVEVDGRSVIARQEIPAGHKIALASFDADEHIIKYGAPIGRTTECVAAGDWVHSHNLRTALGGLLEYSYRPTDPAPRSSRLAPPATFSGYRRSNGSTGTRNELWVLNTVGCV